MKPIIIYRSEKDKIILTKEEFEKYINEAYSSGYNEGYVAGTRYYTPPITLKDWQITNQPNLQPPNLTTPLTNPFRYDQVTCEAHNATGD